MRRRAGRILAVACAVLVLAGCGQLTIPSRGISKVVIAGGQAELDRGYVVLVNGLPGLWIAGHRTSAGGPFRNLIGLGVGDEVDFAGRRYVVVGFLSVDAGYRPPYLASLVLQTSRPEGGAYLWLCEPA